MDELIVIQCYKEFRNGESEDYYIGKGIPESQVIRIEYHQPMGEGDAHYCDIFFSCGSQERLFRPDIVNSKHV